MSIFSLSAVSATGRIINLNEFKGCVTFIVNIGSLCSSTTTNMVELSRLPHVCEGRVQVLAFPSNDFANQEPKSALEVQEWAHIQYNSRFHFFEKVHIKGPNAHPLYSLLAVTHGVPRWNYTKYVCDPEGYCRAKYGQEMCSSDVLEMKAYDLL